MRVETCDRKEVALWKNAPYGSLAGRTSPAGEDLNNPLG